MRTLYLDCSSGVAGDMLLGALLDAGPSEADVRAALDALDVPGWSLTIEEVRKRGIRATKADVHVAGDAPPRTFRDIVAIVERAALAPSVKALSLQAFGFLNDAEARVHGGGEQAHFHEVGATDAIIDIVGTTAAFDHFSPAHVVTSTLATGSGVAHSEHGELSVPVPAVTEILARANAPVVGRGPGELTTPTGAALVAVVTDSFGDIPPMRLQAAGYGAGTRDLEWPNVVRVLVGEAQGDTTTGTSALLVETNIDDMNPELVPYVIEALMSSGAQDAWVTPIVMKKGRPATTLSVLVDPSDRGRICDVLFRETTTFGMRFRAVEKEMLAREWMEVEVEGFPVRVKIGRRGDDVQSVAPEHEDAAEVARKTGLGLRIVYEIALKRAREELAR